MSIRGPRKGENYELSIDLNSEYKDKRKDAIKRVIASMTVGKGSVSQSLLSCDSSSFQAQQMSAVSFQMSSKTCRQKI
jgi:vesicle coat complex subunit